MEFKILIENGGSMNHYCGHRGYLVEAPLAKGRARTETSLITAQITNVTKRSVRARGLSIVIPIPTIALPYSVADGEEISSCEAGHNSKAGQYKDKIPTGEEPN
jgi:hypothetical protein